MARYDGADIAQMLGNYRGVIESVVADPSQPISALPLARQSERHQLT